MAGETVLPADRRTPAGARLLSPRAWFRRQTLSLQFLLTSGVLILLAAAVSGYLISRKVSDSAAANRADATALFMQSILEPAVRELGLTGKLSAEQAERLDRLFAEPQFVDRFPYFELWLLDGRIVYSTSKELIGRRFAEPSGLVRAMGGEVAAQYTDLMASEHTLRGLSAHYLEIYSPVRRADTGEIVAVAEIHEDTDVLHREMFEVRLIGWTVVAGASLAIMLGLLGIVRRGSATIEAQRLGLERRAREAERVSEELRQLRDRARLASLRMTDFNERLTRGIGADLHDGPAQLIGFAVLQMDAVRRARRKAERDGALDLVGGTLQDALEEIRMIAKALLLPDIERLNIDQVIARVARLHEARTGTKVCIDTSTGGADLPPVIKTCIYRFLQEGLNNAHHHAGGNGQTVRCHIEGALLALSVSDAGARAGATVLERAGEGGLGLHGLRQRVESLGGTLRFTRREDGAELLMTLDLGGGLLDG